MSPAVEAPRDIRMTLLRDEFIAEEGGRLPAGTVVLVDEKTAKRWRIKNIGVDSAITDKTLRDQKVERLQQLQAEIDELERAAQHEPATNGRPSRSGR